MEIFRTWPGFPSVPFCSSPTSWITALGLSVLFYDSSNRFRFAILHNGRLRHCDYRRMATSSPQKKGTFYRSCLCVIIPRWIILHFRGKQICKFILSTLLDLGWNVCVPNFGFVRSQWFLSTFLDFLRMYCNFLGFRR